MSAILAKEKCDVDKLHKLSLAALFFETLGNREQKIQKEQQEFLSAKLKYDNCKSSIASIIREIAHIEYEIKRLGNPESEYDKIINDKESILKAENNSGYIQFVDRMAKLKSQINELREALTAGDEVKSELSKVIGYLKSAGNWGTIDMLGGGLVTTALKHSKIDGAKRSVHQVQYLMERFYRELADVERIPNSALEIQIGSFDTFADYFFDGLIFDWMVQSKINRSLENSRKVETEITRILNILKNELLNLQNDMKRVEQEKTKFIENI